MTGQHQYLEKVYDSILEQCRAREEIVGPTVEPERRSHPRIRVESGDFWVDSIAEYGVLDISVSGIAFASNFPLQRGEEIKVGLARECTAGARVVDCRLVESPTQYNDAEFRVQCEFLEPATGMELLVRAKLREMFRAISRL